MIVGAGVLNGTNAADLLLGLGAGDNTFSFASTAAADGDTILLFEPGDRLDLSGIDADSGSLNNDTFTLLTGDAVFNAAGQLRIIHETRDGEDFTLVEGNTNGDTVADFNISIRGTITSRTTTSSCEPCDPGRPENRPTWDCSMF